MLLLPCPQSSDESDDDSSEEEDTKAALTKKPAANGVKVWHLLPLARPVCAGLGLNATCALTRHAHGPQPSALARSQHLSIVF
jgi:hypothetical protein